MTSSPPRMPIRLTAFCPDHLAARLALPALLVLTGAPRADGIAI